MKGKAVSTIFGDVSPEKNRVDLASGELSLNFTGGVVDVVDLVQSGDHVGHVPVKLSYGIIERFSEGLYSSPNKTFEELITNSYDAGAREVWVYLEAYS